LFPRSADAGGVHSVPTRRSSDLPPNDRVPPVAGRGWFGGAGDAIMPETARGAMSDDRRLGFVTYFLRSNPTRTAWMVGLLALARSEEHTSELQSRENLVCRLLLE